VRQDPIDRLLEEHRTIMREVAKLRRAIIALDAEGAPALPRVLSDVRDAVAWLGVELLAHARREDDALFPTIERELGDAGGPTEVMRGEHRAIQTRAEQLRSTVRELNDVQHPALVRAGAALEDLAAAGDDAGALRTIAREMIALLDDHFLKEEEILFPIARDVLSREALDRVARRMEELDAEHTTGRAR
jgi:iron-sulfur cluster repair protein YtfE (RIC family)